MAFFLLRSTRYTRCRCMDYTAFRPVCLISASIEIGVRSSRSAAGEIAIPGLQKGQSHGPGGLGPQDARPQATDNGPGPAERLDLFVAQAALGTHDERDTGAGGRRQLRAQRLGRALPQTDEQAGGSALREPRDEAHGGSDLGDDAAAALLGRLLGHALPAREAGARAPRLHA